MYGTQTHPSIFQRHILFENDVKMYGTQTLALFICIEPGLRMM